MSNEEMQNLVSKANEAHGLGQIDQEIESRLAAFVLSEKNPPKLVEELEKAAHLICYINDSLENPSSEDQWRQATRYAEWRHGITEGAILELVKAECPERAFSVTQRIKSPSLVRRLRAHTLAREDLSPTAIEYRVLLKEKDDIQNQLRQARRDNEQEEIQRLLDQNQKLLESLGQVGIRLRKDDPKAFAGLCAPLEPDDLLPLFSPDGGGCLVDLYFASTEGVALIASREGSAVKMVGVVLNGLDRQLFANESMKWFQALHSGQMTLVDQGLISLLGFLHDRLMCSLGNYLLQHNHWQITIIPHLMAHSLPLHLTPICCKGGKTPFFELFTTSYAPCVQLALLTVLRPRPIEFIKGELPALLFADPRDDLPASRLEQEKVSEQLSHHPWQAAAVPQTRFVGRSANLAALLQNLPNAGIVYLATHANFKMADPYGSGILVADEASQDDKMWTVDEIYTSNHLKNNPVVIISACESGMSYFDESAEIVALPPAFVCVGAAAVLGSLWPVEDVSTSFLVERYTYHLMDPGETPSSALSLACGDLQKYSREEALKRCDELISCLVSRGAPITMGGEAFTRLVGWKETIASGLEHPFAHPFFWGGFLTTGSGWRSGGGNVVASRSPQASVDMAMAIAKVQESMTLQAESKYTEAIALVEQAIPKLDGLWLGRALLLQGDCIYRQVMESRFFDFYKIESALKALSKAYDILQAQEDKEDADYCMRCIKAIKGD